MNQHTISCTIIHRNQNVSRILEAVLRKADFNVSLRYSKSWQDFEGHLAEEPALVFSPGDFLPEQEARVLEAIQSSSPDSVLVKIFPRRWESLTTRLLGVEVCSVSSQDQDYLQQQVGFLLHYASLKMRFRHCKHLLSMAELRCQWLVDYSREPVAFIAGGRHLHANVAYLSLFGFSSESEALATPLAKLVKPDERDIFRTLNSSAELSARPSNKLLMTLCKDGLHPFRAEIRFIPSVFHGQRCVQLHVHPVNVVAAQKPRQSPWEKKALATNGRPTNGKPIGGKASPSVQMQSRFQEALNMRASSHPSLLIAQPYLQYASGNRVYYPQLVQDADNGISRFRLDWWNIRSTLKYLGQHAGQKGQRVMVALGAWVFTHAEQVKGLLRLLNKNQRLAGRLVLAIRWADIAKHGRIARQVLPALQSNGAQLALDNILQVHPQLVSGMKATGAGMVRLHPSWVKGIADSGEVPVELQESVQLLDNAGLTVIVDGVQDITSLNMLCITQTTYLQGDILNKFSR